MQQIYWSLVTIASIVKQVISSVVKGIDGRVRRAGRENMDENF